MNTKKVKQLRRKLGYHPSQPRLYEKSSGRRGYAICKGTRRVYQQMKKVLRERIHAAS